jgi:hypothetical protein
LPRSAGLSIDNNFVGGLVTQKTGLNFPENACTDTDNCVFNERGSVTRRFPFDFEENYDDKAITKTGSAITSYLWKNASGDGTVDLIVVQVGVTLYFYKTNDPEGVSSTAIANTITLTDFDPAGAPSPKNNECEFAAGLGYLIVVHPNLEPFIVQYTAASDTFTTTMLTLKIRDFVGELTDANALTTRPNANSNAHNYNLQNQGWTTSKITAFEASVTDYPSNADVWWYFKDTSNVFDPSVQASISIGNTPAPKGFFILSAFNQDRTTASGIATLTTTSASYYRPSAVAFFAGRAFYAGVNFLGFNNKIYFSQIIEQAAQFAYCYQAADPTSEQNFELQPSDGGVISIPDAGTIYKLVPLGNALLVFATNGIWAISGSQGIGFTANDYTISFLSAIRSISTTNFVDVGGIPSFWNADGIWTVVAGQQGGYEIKSLTDDKIKDYFLEIPALSKRKARGYYNPFTHVVQWLFRSQPHASLDESYEYDRILNLNTLTGAFYPWSVGTDLVHINNLVVVETGGNALTTTNEVTSGGGANNVQDALGNNVVTYGLGSGSNIRTTTKYLVNHDDGGTQFTWAESADFNAGSTDWLSQDDVGEEYESYFIVGYKVRGEGARKFQPNYVFVFSDNEEDTSYYFQSQWNYSTSGDSGKWSSRQLVEHDTEDFNVLRRKLKTRGHGYAVQYKFSNFEDQPFHIIGWSAFETANERP